MFTTRSFCTSARCRAIARTTLRPTVLLEPPSPHVKSVLVLATPPNLQLVIGRSIELHRQNLQVIVAGVNAVANSNNGVSELWLDNYFAIGDLVLLDDKDKKKELRRSDGVHIVTAKENWKNISSSLEIGLGGHSVVLSLANTVFHTEKLATMFYFQPLHLPQLNLGQTLSDLKIVLNEEIDVTATASDRWTALYDESDFRVTRCTGNLIKTINKQPAAKFLEENRRLMDLASKDTLVFVKLANKRYEVIAGGGGWGAKAGMLALLPDARPRVGDRIEFFMLAPADRYRLPEPWPTSGFSFDCTNEETGYHEPDKGPELALPNVFGCGCEHGFRYDGVNFRSPGERLTLSSK